MEKWIQITAGRGPAECCWLVAQLVKRLLKDAKANTLSAVVIEQEKGEQNRTLRSALIQLKGREKELDVFTKSWQGSVLWVGKSPFRKYHKRKNWFVGVKVIDTSPQELTLREADIQYQVYRSSGPGGQHANKVSSAVRALHNPTGCMATASDSRSQQHNKKKAKERLLQLVKVKQMDFEKEKIQDNWQNHNQLERGNPVRTFKGSRLEEI